MYVNICINVCIFQHLSENSSPDCRLLVDVYMYIHMGWLRLVRSLKSYVSFAEYRLSYMALLQKRPIILRSLLHVATPYVDT